MEDIINNARSVSNGNELKIISTNEGFNEIFKMRQSLINQMNRDKRIAIEKVESEYHAKLDELNRMYAMTLSMLSSEDQ